eukprot:6061796-Prymnesium_polylepis.2
MHAPAMKMQPVMSLDVAANGVEPAAPADLPMPPSSNDRLLPDGSRSRSKPFFFVSIWRPPCLVSRPSSSSTTGGTSRSHAGAGAASALASLIMVASVSFGCTGLHSGVHSASAAASFFSGNMSAKRVGVASVIG